ncbi:hypothetical protein ACFQV4_06220 [Streptomyces thermocarboxydus]
MRWTGTCWRELDEAQMRARMYERLEYAVYSARSAPSSRNTSGTG